jgi:hypothetical protein
VSDTTLTMLTIIGLAFGIVGATYGAWRRFRPGIRRASSALDAIIGKEAVTDRSGQVIEPGQPGLVHRVATVEEAVVEIRHVVALWTETQHTLTEHASRIKALEDSRIDRLVAQAESAHMWRAVADNAITDEDGS